MDAENERMPMTKRTVELAAMAAAAVPANLPESKSPSRRRRRQSSASPKGSCDRKIINCICRRFL